MKATKKSQERMDLMDARCDRMDEDAAERHKYVAAFAKTLDDQQLQSQIDGLFHELEDAKNGETLFISII